MVNPFSWLLNRKKKKKAQKPGDSQAEDPEFQQLVDTLKEIPLLSNLNENDIRELATNMTLRTYEKDEHVFREGDAGNEFFFVNEGTADVIAKKDGELVKVFSLRKSDYFGDQALLTDSVRNATIKATSTLEVLVLNRQQFQNLTKGDQVVFAQRQAVMANDNFAFDTSEPPRKFERGEEELKFIKDSIVLNLLFQAHEDEVIEEVAHHFDVVELTKGDDIIREGEEGGTRFFVLAEGEVLVNTKKAGNVTTLLPGRSFGELALLYNAPRNATIQVCSETAKLYVMERDAFRYVVISAHRAEDEGRFGFLRAVKLFKPLLENELTLIDMALTVRDCQPNESIFKQGDPPEKFYIVKEGTVNGIIVKGDQKEEFVKSVGGYFGELALLRGEPRAATISAGADGCKLLQLSTDDFKDLLGPLKLMLERNEMEYQKPINERRIVGEEQSKICSLDELLANEIGLLGRGAFGKVTLVVDPHTKKSYALKAIKKTQIEDIGQSSHIVNEKRVMMMMNNRFLVNLHRTYKDDWRVYFLVDVCLGGELFTILRKKRSFNEDLTRFYAGCVVEAFDYLHSMNIIYRDLKPENLVMDSNGYVKVTDFGFAKVVPKKTYTLCGTPDYLAPEIVTGQGHGKAVDWWCLGVLVYELLSSFPPFFDDEPMGTYRKIIQGKFKFPKYFSADARDLIARLLRTRPTKRLAVMKGGANNIRNHSWYKNFNWATLQEGSMEAPYMPEVKGFKDISNFDQKDKRASVVPSGKPPKTPWDAEF